MANGMDDGNGGGNDPKKIKKKSPQPKPQPPLLGQEFTPSPHSGLNTFNINGDANFGNNFENNKNSLAPPKGDPLWKHYLKNPDKLRDLAIVIFFAWAILTGGVSVKDLIDMAKGGKKDTPAQIAPALTVPATIP